MSIRKELRGPIFLFFSIVFTGGTIFAVLWDIERQKLKRTESARYRITQTAQQYQNLADYMEQKQKFEEYKRRAMANDGENKKESI